MNNKFEQLWIKPMPIDDPGGNYNGFYPSSTLLKRGYVKKENCPPIPCDIIWERDVAVKLRDGIIIYTDIYRPVKDDPVPVVISWSPYGKSNIDLSWAYDDETLSHLQKEEGVDPAFWCNHGYAVAHPDARGSYMSEGNIFHWGMEHEGKDIYDYIEWLAERNWCSGKIGMAGNSYLSISQWFAAANEPPHLTAIAPWEGFNDAFRDSILRGGIPDTRFPRLAVSVMHSNNYVDDMPNIAENYPLMNDYWLDKRAKFENITIPAYIVASYTNPIHTNGTFRAYRSIKSKDNWLRIHNSHEWVDFYKPEKQAELMKFFDYYLKDISNGWEETPAVRMSLLDPGGEDVVERVEETFPPKGTVYKKYYLNTIDGSLNRTLPNRASFAFYRGDVLADKLVFTCMFDQYTELAGYPKLHLYVEGEDCDDMDLFIYISKVDQRGNVIEWRDNPPNRYQGPFEGISGRLRVSLRALDENLSTQLIPEQSFEREEKLSKGEIVEVEIPIWPIGMVFHSGERLAVSIMNGTPNDIKEGFSISKLNTGKHFVHSGGQYDSYLNLPINGVVTGSDA